MGPGNQVFAGGGDFYQAFAFAVADAGDYQAAFQGDGNADVDGGVVLQMVAPEKGVELGMPAQGNSGGPDHQVIDADPLLGGQSLVNVPAQGHSLAHIHFGGNIEMGGVPLAVAGNPRNGLPHSRQGNQFPHRFSRRGYRFRRFH